MQVSQTTIAYFAYGANMNMAGIQRRAGPVSVVCRATLANHELQFSKSYSLENSRGYANIHPKEGANCEGVLFQLTPEQIEALDHYEDYPEHYDRKVMLVRRQDSEELVPASLYIAQETTVRPNLKPTKEYLSQILEGAREHNLSASHIDWIERTSAMRIAIIAIGSLVNHPYSPIYQVGLEARRADSNIPIPNGVNIKPDSPFLPALGLKLPICLGRFSGRDSANRRITMVIDERASEEPVYFAESTKGDLEEAIDNLRKREGIGSSGRSLIGYVDLVNGSSNSRSKLVAEKIGSWAMQNGFHAVIWTDLPENGASEVLPALQSDPILLQNTKAYIRDLPNPPTAVEQLILSL